MTGELAMRDETIVKDTNQFSDWLKTGQTLRCVYYRGDLIFDCDPRKDESADATARRRELMLVRGRAWQAAVEGDAYLVQRRVCKSTFEYLAIRPVKDGCVPKSWRPDDEEVKRRREREAKKAAKISEAAE